MLIAVAVVSLSSAPLFAGTVVFQENFNELTAQLDVTSAGQFTAINGTNVDIVGPSNGWGFLVVAPESGNAIDLGGTGGNPFGQLQSSAITLGPGSYTLTYDLNGSQRSGYGTTSTSVSLGTASDSTQLYSQQFNELAYNDDPGLVSANFSVVGTETVYLNFDLTASGYGNVGSLLDNVAITQNSSFNNQAATPEPSSLMLLGTGLSALAGLARRKLGRS
jgi:hypothetical protein